MRSPRTNTATLAAWRSPLARTLRPWTSSPSQWGRWMHIWSSCFCMAKSQVLCLYGGEVWSKHGPDPAKCWDSVNMLDLLCSFYCRGCPAHTLPSTRRKQYRCSYLKYTHGNSSRPFIHRALPVHGSAQGHGSFARVQPSSAAGAAGSSSHRRNPLLWDGTKNHELFDLRVLDDNTRSNSSHGFNAPQF